MRLLAVLLMAGSSLLAQRPGGGVRIAYLLDPAWPHPAFVESPRVRPRWAAPSILGP